MPCGRGCDKQGARPVNGICGTYFTDESYVMHLCDSATVRREGATKTEASTEADVMFAVDSRGRGCERVSGRPSSVLLMTTRTMTLLECVRRVGASPGSEELRTQNSEEGFCLSDRQTGHDANRDKPGKDILPPGKSRARQQIGTTGPGREKRWGRKGRSRTGVPAVAEEEQSAEREEREARLDLVRRNDMTDRVGSQQGQGGTEDVERARGRSLVARLRQIKARLFVLRWEGVLV